jgi:secreted PhoX family phosphatase
MTDSLTKYHPESPNGEDDVSKNFSSNAPLNAVMDARLARRSLIKGGVGLLATSFAGLGLAHDRDDHDHHGHRRLKLGFNAVDKNLNDLVTLPSGYTYSVLYALGDPINTSVTAYANDGTDSADSHALRAGDHHDGMAYFGLQRNGRGGRGWDQNNSTSGLLCMNHENITRVFLHSAAEVAAGFNAAARVTAQIDKEVNAHGISVFEVRKEGGHFHINKASAYNRRYTAASTMELSGPVRGSALLQTKYSPDGTKTRGTLNNCANGTTPWGTYLTCEENWAGYFKRPVSPSTATSKQQVAQNRYMGTTASNGSYGWANPAGGDTSGTDQYKRWDVTPTGASATEDYRNAANTFGWVVEIDPFKPGAAPRKRTAMGRFAHEGAFFAPVKPGKPVVYYMGDDSQGEYMYKFVSKRKWNPSDADDGLAAGDKYLNEGTLYVATYHADGTGSWTALSLATPSVAAGVVSFGYNFQFADQADVLVHARLAADAAGATPMDRPEWAGVHPVTGEIYLTLTNNSTRGQTGNYAGGKPRGLDASNPRYYDDGSGSKGNRNGHIIRMKEEDCDGDSLTFKWDLYLFGAEVGLDGNNINISNLTDDNDFSSPDGLWFSHAVPGLMWLQTDDGAYTDVTNCMMLAALPGRVGDGDQVSVTSLAVPSNGGADQTVTTFAGKDASADKLRRFLVGPKGCEITGITETPDGRTLFVNIQHPGEDTTAANIGIPANFQSHWPDGGSARPRSATIVITKNDGGIIGC